MATFDTWLRLSRFLHGYPFLQDCSRSHGCACKETTSGRSWTCKSLKSATPPPICPGWPDSQQTGFSRIHPVSTRLVDQLRVQARGEAADKKSDQVHSCVTLINCKASGGRQARARRTPSDRTLSHLASYSRSDVHALFWKLRTWSSQASAGNFKASMLRQAMLALQDVLIQTGRKSAYKH